MNEHLCHSCWHGRDDHKDGTCEFQLKSRTGLLYACGCLKIPSLRPRTWPEYIIDFFTWPARALLRYLLKDY